jgi:uncharacterized protein (DUF1778 family)
MKPLDKALSDVSAAGLGKGTPNKAARIDLRVTEGERDEMRATADKLGLSLSEYILQLHRHARKHL